VEAHVSTSYVALLRGINVGRAKRIAMADLRALAGRLGFEDRRTLLNSGNLVFRGSGSPGQIAARLHQAIAVELGVESRVIVLPGREFAEVVEQQRLPRAAANASRMLVVFVAETGDLVKLKPVQKQRWQPEALAVGKRAAYVWCPAGIAKSALVEAVGRALGPAVTMRNWATVQKLRAML
jgi:uncharacterized protein (DUF1697 family)